MRKPLRRIALRAAFTLSEMMISIGVFAVGASIAYPLLVSDMNLYARNFSLNKSNNSLRYALQTLKSDIDMSIEPPRLMSYAATGGVGAFTPLGSASNVTSADAILMWVNLGPAYDMVPTTGSGTGGTINPSTGITLNCAPNAPVPQVGDRLIILSPLPYTTSMPETVSMNGGNIQKPGRRITGVSTATGGFTVTLDLKNPLPTGITGDKSVYIVREVAYAAVTLSDAYHNAIERQLITYRSTNNMTAAKLLIRDLDPTPQAADALVTTSTMAFSYPGGNPDGTGTANPLRINLPIRALDYAHAIADRNLGGNTVDSSPTEFNVFLRSNVQMNVRTRLD